MKGELWNLITFSSVICSVTLTHIPADEYDSDSDLDLVVGVNFQPRTECDRVSIVTLLCVCARATGL